MTTDGNPDLANAGSLGLRAEESFLNSEEIRFIQLDPGQLSVLRSEVRFPDVILRSYRITHSATLELSHPPGWNSFVLCGNSVPSGGSWCGVPVLRNSLLMFRPDGGHRFFAPAGWNDIEVLVTERAISDFGLLDSAALDRMDCPKRGQLPLSPAASCEASTGFLALLADQCSDGHNDISPAAHTKFRTRVMSLLSQLIYGAVSSPDDDLVRQTIRRYSIVDRALEQVSKANGQYLAVEELSERIGANPRGLQRAFKDVFGISPYQYLLRRRLNGARAKLLNWPREPIATVSACYGFSSPSEFTANYRRFFGETPTETRIRYQ